MKELSQFHTSQTLIHDYLDLVHRANLESILQNSIWAPLQDFFKVPGKNIRPKLVELGFKLATSDDDGEFYEKNRERLEIAGTVVEAIHAGALIIDDIEDGSVLRRNLPTLHLKHGLPKALNAGNWLYFWGLEQIEKLKLPTEDRLKLTDDCLRYISRAHLGQAVDIGSELTTIPQSQVSNVCLASMELKTGTLLALALRLGAAVGGYDDKDGRLNSLGVKLGILLQLFDDIGNLTLPISNSPSKRLEDLRLRRPTWVWAQAALHYDEASYQSFIQAVLNLPSEDSLNEWTRKNCFHECLNREAKLYLDSFINECQKIWGQTHFDSTQTIISLGKYLEKAYVQ